MDHQEPIPLTTHPAVDRPNRRHRTDHSSGHPLGIQHGANNRRRPTQGSFHNQSRTFQTNSNVLRTHQLPSDVPDHDGYDIPRTDRTRNPHGIHGRHSYTHQTGAWRNGRSTSAKTPTVGKRNAHHTTKTQPLPQHRQVPIRETRGRLPRGPHRRKEHQNGRSQSRTSKNLETPPKCDRSMTLLGVHRVLPVLHQRILTNSPATPQFNKEKHRVALGKSPTTSLRRAKEQDVQ